MAVEFEIRHEYSRLARQPWLKNQKKDRHLEQVNQPLSEQLKSTAVVIVKYVEEAEADEMWSFVYSKKQERWS